MNSEWLQIQIKDLGRIVTGKTPSTAQKDYFDGDVPFLTPTDMVDGQKTVGTARTLTGAGVAVVKNCLIPKGVAVSCIGWQMGKAVLVLEPTVTNQQINTIVVDESRFDLSFIFYLLFSMRPQIFELGATPTRTPIVNKSTFGAIKIRVPALAKQGDIASICSALDNRIALLRETNATLEAIARALFKSWFVDFDPVHAKQEGRVSKGMDEATASLFPDSFDESELVRVPSGWRIGTLADISSISSGKRPLDRSDERSAICQIPLYGGAGLMGYTSASLFDSPRIVTGRVGTLGKVHIVYPPFWASDNVLVLAPKQSAAFAYSLHLMRSIDVHSLNRGSTQPLLTQKDLGAQLCVIPPIEILTRFEEVVSPLYEQIRDHTGRMGTITALRDTLLPRLISGQLCLPEATDLMKHAA